MSNTKNFLNGIQINPLSFVDEGVENCIDNFRIDLCPFNIMVVIRSQNVSPK